ncbi:MAG: rhodanese-like domain-containing protein [Verrucomicrobiaceae bacterium]|nr:rhodanese-like domain-containing protein [Verrucomicrobiaceae bacterium]
MKPHRFSFFLGVIAVALSPLLHADEKAADGAVHVTADAAAKLVQESKVTVLDVRTADEFGECHISGAMNIDFLDSTGFEKRVKELDKSRPYLVHCQSGGRSSRSLKIFKKLGFEKVYHLDGGLGAWQAAGKPVEKK